MCYVHRGVLNSFFQNQFSFQTDPCATHPRAFCLDYCITGVFIYKNAAFVSH